jgi:hypothetical protein
MDLPAICAVVLVLLAAHQLEMFANRQAEETGY